VLVFRVVCDLNPNIRLGWESLGQTPQLTTKIPKIGYKKYSIIGQGEYLPWLP